MYRHSEQIKISGQVQGVGFRPLVWQLASRLGIRGEVRNGADGVTIIAQANPQAIEQLLNELTSKKPPLANIREIDRQHLETATTYLQFSIGESITGKISTSVVTDTAPCPACLREIETPGDRRYQHAFANCTHCGPRLSITSGIPYDRNTTSMAEFEMCDRCASEYHDPADRRFHAQPTCCPDCGPQLSLRMSSGELVTSTDCIEATAQQLSQGAIVAIKGVGGFQLACLATDEMAIARLRERKERPDKPLALMAADLNQVARYCHISEAELTLLTSPARPIILLDQKPDCELPAVIAPRQNRLGFMLPSSPLHHLLLQSVGKPVVLTSGNINNEPQCIDNQQAIERLGGIADFFLMHNRDIVNRLDDSVVHCTGDIPQILRRARGYAPAPIPLPKSLQQGAAILACGADMKNTYAMARDSEVTLSPHIGDLHNPTTLEDFELSTTRFEQLFDCKPDMVAVDCHPDYQSSRFGRQLAEHRGIRLIEVQHHHAHIAGCLAENGWQGNKPVIGIALDGIGLGTDGNLWGGELLLCDYLGFTRLGCLQPYPLAGGNLASRQPWRNALAQLKQAGLWEVAQRETNLDFGRVPAEQLAQSLDTHYPFPQTTSCGRLFDAVAAILGLSSAEISFEGQAACELEDVQRGMDLSRVAPYPFDMVDGTPAQIGTTSLWRSILSDLQDNVDSAMIAARFHAGLAKSLTDLTGQFASRFKVTEVALSGGVFQNRSLLAECLRRMLERDLKVYLHCVTPCNDGGLSLGQAAIARAISLKRH